ncbi:tropomyosin-like isoform X2 [Hyla sarda]|uniref:tropomyosin-like isoform X2 n=1 Tax=Hyla sarda TaxID=327740 RepID=UPI0024C3E8F9|nr:tropomyosin-like isoform X2 [Hyla sarda]
MGSQIEVRLQMDFLEDFLAGDEENLCSYTMGDLEEIVHLLSSQVHSHREELHKMKDKIQDLEAEAAQSLRRDFYISRHSQDLQEALEEEEKMQQQLQATTREMERLSEAGSSESCEVLEARLKESEDLLSTYCQEEKALVEEVRILKTDLEKSQSALEQATGEHQTVESELLSLQNGLSAQSYPAQGEAARVLSACIQEMASLNLIPGKRLKR